MNCFEFQKKFDTELSVIKCFIQQRYPNGMYYPKCEATTNNVYHRNTSPKMCHCNNCKSEFSILANTIFEKSDTDLRKWFYAINLVLIAERAYLLCS